MILKSSDENVILENSNEFNLINPLNFNYVRPSDISGCIYYWNFNEGTGNTFVDSIQGKIGSLYFESGALWSGGRFGSGISTDNQTNRYKAAVFGTNADFCSGQKTWSIWVYPTMYETGTAYVFGNMVMNFRKDNNNKFTFGTGRLLSSSGPFITVPQPGSEPTNNWTHLVSMYSPDIENGNGYDALYINGQFAGSTSLGSKYIYIDYGTQDLKWGTTSHGTWTPMTANFDETAIFDRVLSEYEIKKLYDMGYSKFYTLNNSNNELNLKSSNDNFTLKEV